MKLKTMSLLICVLFIKPQDNYYMRLDNDKPNNYVLDLRVEPENELLEIKKIEQPNLLCSNNKFITYTNIDNINLNNFNLNDYYTDENGYVRENGTNAIYCAMATNYKKNNYYTITTNTNESFVVKVVDVKSNEHTTNSCYTTHDNSIVELWITNQNYNFKNLGNSKIVGVSVIEIKE